MNTTNDRESERFLAAAAGVITNYPAGKVFIGADVLRDLEDAGLLAIAERRRLGPLMLRLRRCGIVEKLGTQSTPARSHGGVTTVWRRTGFD
ncbi:hypothetical protein AB0G00_27230 [Nocardia salmonicida]|uniref:hypothetical protein n=1 Tax=Nocardia salmonicida TaxID=53431 RepID=UPI00340DF577